MRHRSGERAPTRCCRNGCADDHDPGALDDSAPDAWGRNLITRRRTAQVRDAGHTAPVLSEVDHLLGVNDLTRQGALRFCLDDDQPFLAESHEIPQLLELETLLDAAREVSESNDADDAVATLLAAGSGSLGGARPKASVSDGTTLFVAKFPHRPDRVPYLSARSLIGACDGRASDHLRNHAVVGGRTGWTRSPIFDVNPDPNPRAARATSIAGATEAAACLEALFDSAASFDLDQSQATKLWQALLEVSSRWRQVATRHGITEASQSEFDPALDRWRP